MTKSLAGEIKDTPLGEFAHKAWQVALGAGILSVALGVFLLVKPGPTLSVIGVIFGIYLLVSGVAEIVLGFSVRLSGWTRVICVITGILSVWLGVLCFRDELESILLLGVWIGTGWIITGSGRVVASASGSFPGRGWAIVTGLLLALGGVVMIIWPIGSVAMLSLVASIWLIVIGVAQIIDSIQMRHNVSKAVDRLNSIAS